MKLTRDYFKASNMTFRYGLTPIQLSVYCYLVSCASSADYCFPSVKTIALYCNCIMVPLSRPRAKKSS